MRARSLVLVAALTLLACSNDPLAPTDAAADPDAASTCRSDRDCDDGRYCNGAETCAPGASSADASGCVAAEAMACAEGTTCVEVERRCVSCDVARDGDGDGRESLACGGDDCDDADPARFPGNTERCDPDDVDEDCDPTTFGELDTDMDGATDAACCNRAPGTATFCGSDCDDTRADVSPLGAERCDGIDDDCDGRADEGLPLTAYAPDCDRDGAGDARSAPLLACGTPTVAPPCAALDAVWTTDRADCDDTSATRRVGADELCNASDDDCDGTTDEGASARCPAAPFAMTMSCEAGSCLVAACAAGRGNCNGLSSDGCEIDTATSLAHCGGCGERCEVPNGTGVCADGDCTTTGCYSGYHLCSASCVSSLDPATCGSRCTPCPGGPADSHPTCDGTACGWACDDGFVLLGERCVRGPRPIAPISCSFVQGRRPTFRWQLGAGHTGARLQLCADRACSTVLDTFDFSGTSGTPTRDLPSGVVFYRLLGRTGTSVETASGPVLELAIARGTGSTRSTPWGAFLDAEGDGRIDVAVTAGTAEAVVRIFRGVSTGIARTAATTIAAPADLPATSTFGYRANPAGDVNGDGFCDLAVRTTPIGLSGRTPVYVYLGGASGMSSTPVSMLESPAGGFSLFGLDTVIAGNDLDGDGYGDLLVRDRRTSLGAADVYAFRGGPDGMRAVPLWRGAGSTVGYGEGIAAGDYDGDGRLDVAVTQSDSGTGTAVHVYYNTAAGLSAIIGRDLFSFAGALGTPLTNLGDAIGTEGVMELAATRTTAGNTIVFTSSRGALESMSQQTITVAPVSFIGDWNGDGAGDLVGASGSDLAIFTSATLAGPTVTRPAGATQFARAAYFGDYDRDGRDDFVVAAGDRLVVVRGGTSTVADTTLTAASFLD